MFPIFVTKAIRTAVPDGRLAFARFLILKYKNKKYEEIGGIQSYICAYFWGLSKTSNRF
jgi:hypothetical protein